MELALKRMSYTVLIFLLNFDDTYGVLILLIFFSSSYIIQSLSGFRTANRH
jgi:hypothetical protein